MVLSVGHKNAQFLFADSQIALICEARYFEVFTASGCFETVGHAWPCQVGSS